MSLFEIALRYGIEFRVDMSVMIYVGLFVIILCYALSYLS
jgi:hypothetical protein